MQKVSFIPSFLRPSFFYKIKCFKLSTRLYLPSNKLNFFVMVFHFTYFYLKQILLKFCNEFIFNFNGFMLSGLKYF